MYFTILILTLIIGGAAQIYVSHQLKKYSRVPCSYGMTGAEIAHRMNYDMRIPNVGVNHGGPNQDYFDPRTNSITLGTEAYGQRTVTAVATAVHEMGHACQHAEGYAFLKFRSALVPVANVCSNGWIIVFLIGLFLGSRGDIFLQIAVIMFAAVLLFELITLPVEFDASRRGLAYLEATGMNGYELSGAKSVLRACAFTYVASALTALLQMLYLLVVARDN